LPPEELEPEVQDEPYNLELPDSYQDGDPIPLYAEDGSALFYDRDTGDPVDLDGNVIPARYEETEEGRAATGVATPPAVEPDIEVPALAARPATTFRSPFADGLLTDGERAEAEQLADPQVLSLIETIAARTADRIVAARDQQRSMYRELGISEDAQEEVASKMAQAEMIVPREMRGTRQGANIALVAAALQEAGDSGNVFDVMKRWSSTKTAAPVIAPAAVRPTTPMMSPSARSVAARPAPDSTRANRAPKLVGTLTQDQMAIIRAERKTGKHGR
jgi:hypothetical protein